MVSPPNTHQRAHDSVRIRSVQPSDADAVDRFYATLSEETLYRRFCGPHPPTAANEISALCARDPLTHLSLVAMLDDAVVGLGTYYRIGDGTSAEVAFVVGDGLQHHGIGTALLRRLAEVGWHLGLRTFTADMLATNATMFNVFRAANIGSVTAKTEYGISQVSIGLSRPQA